MQIPTYKSILVFSLPLIISTAFWNLQFTIDRMFLANYSTQAIAASMSVTGLFWIPMALLHQTAAYTLAFVAQNLGAKHFQDIGYSITHGIYVSIFGGILFLILVPLSPFIFNMIGHAPHLQALESQYFQAMCFSALPMAAVAAIGGFFTGINESSKLMWINFIGLISNVILDYLLVAGRHGFAEMGILGAGIATGLASYAAMFFGFFLMFQKKYREPYSLLKTWGMKKAQFYSFLKYGIPNGLQFALEGIAFTAFLIILGYMKNGELALAASGILVSLLMICILPAMGIGQAIASLVGQCIGEKKLEIAEASTYKGFQITFVFIVLINLSIWLFPDFYLQFFSADSDPESWHAVKTLAKQLLIFLLSFTLFDSMNFCFSSALKGAGDTRFVSIVVLITPWPLMVIPTYFFSKINDGVYYSWASICLYVFAIASIFYLRFRGGKWKSMSVIAET